MPGKLQIQTLLNQPYDRITFVGEVLSSIFDGRLTAYSPALSQTNLTATEERLLQSVEHYADLTLDDGTEVRCFEIRLQPQVRIEQSRVGIQQYVRKLLTAGQAMLVNFVPTNASGHADPTQPWRLTLVAKDTALVNGEIKDRPTHARRYTYLLGPGQACRTAAERLVKLYEQTTLDFTALVQTFEVETLSKAFFKEYKRHYEAVNTYLNGSAFRASVFNGDEKAIRDWSKKLLGRVVFLYFVQKKGWLGASNTAYQDGNARYDINFLTTLFQQSGANDAFYPNWLSPLFFETLNHPRTDDNFSMPDGSVVKVPFLNGGLFDRDAPDRKGPIPLPARLFHNELNPDDPALRGFLDFLNSYNFTVHEDSPDDHYVAVDPEMLGNIFENLLEDNKDKGAFYTPKAIVHYMCQESLSEYLHTTLNVPDHRADLAEFVQTKLPNEFVLTHATAINDLLDSVKICDPAIGSGAFPMGLLQEIYQCKLALPGNTNHAQIKLDVIQNSIYGVDIERGAVDIARLRFWLSLVVDEERPRSLPNLDYKIVVGNSLVSKLDNEILTLDWTLRGTIGAQEEIVILTKKLGQKQRSFFTASGDKVASQREIRDLKIDLLLAQMNLDRAKLLAKMPGTGLFALSAKEQKLQMGLQQQVQGLDANVRKLKALRQDPTKALPYFDWRLDFPEVLNPHVTENVGFDIVVGNPPYVQIQKLDEQTKAALENQKYETYTRMGDLYQLFYELGLNVLVPGGHLCYITSNKWMKAGYGQTLRKYLADNYNPLQLLDFGGVQVFDATVDTNILLVEKGPYSGKTQSVVFSRELKKTGNISDFVRQYSQALPLSNPEAGWVILSPAETRIRRKIEEVGKPLKEWDIQINYGIKTGYNDAFIIDGATKDELIRQDPKSAEIIRPILKGANIKKFKYQESDNWIINSHNGVKGVGLQRINVPDQYPAIYNHLTKFKKFLEIRLDQGDHWTNLRNCAYIQYFEKPKVIWQELSRSGSAFCYVDKPMYFVNTAFMLSGLGDIELKFLTGVLNHKISLFYLEQVYAKLDDTGWRWFKMAVEKIPIPFLSAFDMLPIANLVDKIQNLALTNGDFSTEMKELDSLIFALYHITDEEATILDRKIDAYFSSMRNAK